MDIGGLEGTLGEVGEAMKRELNYMIECARLREEYALAEDRPSDELKDYDILESGVKIAKTVSLKGLSWGKTVETLQEQDLRMPTISEFFEYLVMLYKRGSKGDKDSYDHYKSLMRSDFLGRGVWLDACVREEENMYFLDTSHQYFGNQGIVPLNWDCIPKESINPENSSETVLRTTIHDINSSGIPTRKIYIDGKQYKTRRDLDRFRTAHRDTEIIFRQPEIKEGVSAFVHYPGGPELHYTYGDKYGKENLMFLLYSRIGVLACESSGEE